MEVDSMHALIERKAKRREIFTVDAWEDLIAKAKQNGNSYVVHKFDQDHFIDIEPLLKLQNWTLDENGSKVAWKNAKEVFVDPEKPNKLFFKTAYEDPYSVVNVAARRRGRPVSLPTYEPCRAYSEPIPLKGKKPEHIQTMIDKNIIPREHHGFYESILAIGKPITQPDATNHDATG